MIMDLILASLFTFRLSYMVAEEDGPFHIFVRLRDRTKDFGLFDCAYCVSVYIALFAAWLVADQIILYWLAISGGSIFLHALFQRLTDGL